MHVLENISEKSDNKSWKRLFVIVGTAAIFFIAAGILFVSRVIGNGETPQEYNGHTVVEANELSQSTIGKETSDDYDYISKYRTQYQNDKDKQARNLLKLSRVWGFAIYTHQTFLLGERCWDEELLAMIPVVRFTDENDVNDVLYNWFIGLGDDGYDLNYVTLRSILLESFPDHDNIIVDFFEDTGNHNWPSVDGLYEELWLLNTGFEMNLRPMADLSWINENYLGVYLATALSRFNKVQAVDIGMAPVYFDELGNSVFTNKERFMHIDYADCNYRLLGLFRLWNAVKYFFPYLDIIDYDWSELLLEYIPKMLEGTDGFSYEITLITLASRLRDVHIHFFRGSIAMRGRTIESEIFGRLFGFSFVPVILREAEGHLVVGSADHHELKQGDVILRVNDTDIDEITAAMLRHLPFPNANKALAYLVRGHIVLRQHSSATPMAIDVYRFGEELRVYTDATVARSSFHYIWRYDNAVSDSHMLLEDNIGLINPSMIRREEVHRNSTLHDIMAEFEDVNINGLIIDLRQSSVDIHYLLAEYLLREQVHFVTGSRPSGLVPGVFTDFFHGYSGYGSLARMGFTLDSDELFGSFFHNQNVVLLINEHAQSHMEFTVMTLRNGVNITVMGTNSIGANGNVVYLPLPGGIVMIYTGLGVYSPDGGQTQRIGLSPDIYVPRTIVGISEGRDELMEAAVQFLLEQMLQNE